MPKKSVEKIEKKQKEIVEIENKLEIKNIRLQNIGPFDDLTINFGKKLNKKKANIHIFVGENGSGKSTVLKHLFFHSYDYPTRLLTTNNNDYFTLFETENQQEIIKFENWENIFYYTPNETLIQQTDYQFVPKNRDKGNNLIKNWVCHYPEQEYLKYIILIALSSLACCGKII